jgi:hypothetical protein
METVIHDHTPLADYLKGWFPCAPFPPGILLLLQASRSNPVPSC